MRLATLMASCILALALVPAAAADDWQTFSDPTGLFSVSVPQPMSASNDTTKRSDGTEIGVIVYDLNLGADDELMVRIADFTGRNLDPDKAVEGAVNGMRNAGYALISSTPDNLDRHTGVNATLTDNAGLQYTDRIFFIEDHLFQALTVVPKDVTEDQTARALRFSQSLHFRR